MALSTGHPLKLLLIVAAVALFANGCTTAWKEEPPLYRIAQTHLSVTSSPPGKLYIDDMPIGVTPIATYLNCEEEMTRRTRNVSYWQTEPGYSTLITVLSLGLYLPFSAIPADSETATTPTGSYKTKAFRLRVEADGYTSWQETVRCTGQKDVAFSSALAPTPSVPVATDRSAPQGGLVIERCLNNQPGG